MKVLSVRPSYWFPGVVVIRTECGHFHLRLKSTVTVGKGDNWPCYCETDPAA